MCSHRLVYAAHCHVCSRIDLASVQGREVLMPVVYTACLFEVLQGDFARGICDFVPFEVLFFPVKVCDLLRLAMVCKQLVTECAHPAAELDLCSVEASMIIFGWACSNFLRNEILIWWNIIRMERIRRAHVPMLVPHGILVAIFCVRLLEVIDCLLWNRHFVVSISD